MAIFFGYVLLAGVPFYFVVQPAAILFLPGGWRVAALVPLLLTAPALYMSLTDLSRGGNLWPIPFIAAAVFGSLYLVTLWLARWLLSR